MECGVNNSGMIITVIMWQPLFVLPPTPTLFVKEDGMRVTGLWFCESVNQSLGYNETSHLRYLAISDLLVPKCPLSIYDQHSIFFFFFFFTREYTVEKFIEEHLSSQTGLLLAPSAWCEITNISLKTVFSAQRKCGVTEGQIAVETAIHIYIHIL